MTFTQWRNRLMMCFSEHILIFKWRMTVTKCSPCQNEVSRIPLDSSTSQCMLLFCQVEYYSIEYKRHKCEWENIETVPKLVNTDTEIIVTPSLKHLSKVWFPHAPIFMKFKAANQLSVKKSYIKYYENLTNSLAADARSQTDRQTDRVST